MHMIFSKDELKWVDTRALEWKIKRGCPEEIKVSIEKKLEILKEAGANRNFQASSKSR